MALFLAGTIHGGEMVIKNLGISLTVTDDWTHDAKGGFGFVIKPGGDSFRIKM